MNLYLKFCVFFRTYGFAIWECLSSASTKALQKLSPTRKTTFRFIFPWKIADADGIRIMIESLIGILNGKTDDMASANV